MNISRRFTLLLLAVFFVSHVQAQKTKYVVIIMLDGARYTETFGDSTHTYIPTMWNVLKPQGTIYTSYYNNGKTETNPGHASILSGTWQYIANDGSERSHSPTIFEYFRKQKNVPSTDCWVALGKDKLNVLTNSTHADYGAQYAASYKISTDPANDILTSDNVRFVLTNHRSRITIANFAKIDIEGHAASWETYLEAIKRADSLVTSLWNSIQSDADLKNKTTLIVTNDHGRHTTDFSGHGDGCDGCRHVMLMILGPDTPKGKIDSTLSSQIDIAPTIGKMMRFSPFLAEGKVIESAIAAAANVPIILKNSPTTKISGTYSLQWSTGYTKDSLTTIVEYSKDAGISWNQLLNTTAKDSVYQWNTLNVNDGTRYRLRISVYGDTTYGITQSDQNFTIDNPANGAPDIELLSPNRNIIVSGKMNIVWNAADAEGDNLSLTMNGSTDNGLSWYTIASNLPNTGSYEWETNPVANSKSFRLKIICSDGQASSEVVSPLFEVENIRLKVPSLKQSAGSGNGIVTVNIVNPSQMNGNSYTIEFLDSAYGLKRYNVINVTKNITVLKNILFAADGSEGPLFDGMRLSIIDYPEPLHNKDSTKWIKGNSTLFSKVNLPELVFPEGNIIATPEAADYEIRISNTIIDTSKEYFGASATPMYFTVFNTTLNKKTPIVLTELLTDGKLSFGDDLYFFRKDSSNKDVLSWELFVDGDVNSVNPQQGDIFKVATIKPITGKDIFAFTAVPTLVNVTDIIPQQFELSQNYPNPFNPATNIRVSIPVSCLVKVKVFDLLGREISTIVNEMISPGEYQFEFNAKPFASGVYFYRITAASLIGNRELFTQSKKMIYIK